VVAMINSVDGLDEFGIRINYGSAPTAPMLTPDHDVSTCGNAIYPLVFRDESN